MLGKIQENATEQIATNPSQSAFAVQNRSVFQQPNQFQEAITNPNVTNEAINKALQDDSEWVKYINDPYRKSKMENGKYFAVEDLMSQPEFFAMTNKYGKDLAYKADILRGFNKPSEYWLERQREGFNYAYYSLKASDARNDLAEARQSGDASKIVIAEAKYDKALRDISKYGTEFKQYGNTLMQIAASWARNPETIPVALAGTIAAPVTGGASLALAGVVNAGIVYADTSDLEAGGTLQMLDEEYPDMSETDKFDLAQQVGVINGAIEAIPMLFSGGVLGRGTKVFSKAIAKGVVKSGIKKEMLKNPVFLQEFEKQFAKKSVARVAGEMVGDAAIEALQEDVQNAMQEGAAMVARGETDSVIQGAVDYEKDFLSDPFNPKFADKWQVMSDVFWSSLVFGGLFQGVDKITNAAINRNTTQKKLADVVKNTSVVEQLHTWAKDADTKGIPAEERRAHLQSMVDNGEIYDKVRWDKDAVQEAMKDPKVAEALNNLGMQQALLESENNGNIVETSVVDYDVVVNKPENELLFQKIKSMVAFSSEVMTQSEFIKFLKSNKTAFPELAVAKKNPKSAYNRVLGMMTERGWEQKEAEANATIFQLIANRVTSLRKTGNLTMDEFMNRVVFKLDDKTFESAPVPSSVPSTRAPLDNVASSAIINNKRGNENDESTQRTFRPSEEFRRVQSESQSLSDEELAGYRSGSKKVSDELYERIGRVLSEAVDAGVGGYGNNTRVLENTGDFKVYVGVDPQLFHDAFQIARTYLQNGELVDLHEVQDSKEHGIGYEHCVNYLSADGLSGFSITPTGDVISLFNVNRKRGWLRAIAPEIKSKGKTLDCYMSKKQPLHEMYEAVFGFKVASIMDYNMEYDHDDIAKNHNKPDVAFMVNTEQAVKPKIFKLSEYGKKQYDMAQAYRDSYVLPLFMFAGEQAKDADLGALEEAKSMLMAGKKNEDILKKTGWFVGLDGKWRWEFSDRGARLKKSGLARLKKTGDSILLYELLDHPKLFENYPEFRGVRVVVNNRRKSLGRSFTDFGYAKIELNINDVMEGLRSALSTIVHEIQHAVQRAEGFERGASKSSRETRMTNDEFKWYGERTETTKKIFNKIKERDWLSDDDKKAIEHNAALYPHYIYKLLDRIKKEYKADKEMMADVKQFEDLNNKLQRYDSHTAWGYYATSTGEMEARNTETRLGMTEEERKAMSPYSTLDFNPDIVHHTGTFNGAVKYEQVTEEMIAAEEEKQAQAGEEGYEGGTKDIAGWFQKQGDKWIIALTKAADPTTFAHEAFHMFSNILTEQYNTGELSKYWAERAVKMFKSVDVPVEEGKPVALTRTQEERLAGQFTVYILEGKVKNRECVDVFSYMASVFRKIYRFSHFKYALNKNVTDVFDAVFRSQDEIEYQQRLVGLLEIPMPAGANQEVYDAYIAFLNKSRVKGAVKLMRKLFASDKVRTGKEYKRAEATATQAVMNTNQYKVMDAAINQGLNTVKDLRVFVDSNPELQNKKITDEELKAWLDTVPVAKTVEDRARFLNNWVQDQVNDSMEQWLADRFRISREELALRESNNYDKTRALVAEAIMRRGQTMKEFEELWKKVDASAENLVSGKNLGQLKDKNYWYDLEALDVDKYAFALNKESDKDMAQARIDQAIHQLAKMKADVISKKADEFQLMAARLSRPQEGAQERHKYSAEAYDLLQSIVERFGFTIVDRRRSGKPVSDQMLDWINYQEQWTFTTVGSLRNFIPMIVKGYNGKFNLMKVGMFEKLDAVFHTIDSIASKEYEIHTEKDRQRIAELVTATMNYLVKNKISPKQKSNSFWSAFRSVSSWTNPEPLLKELFPPEVFNTIWLPLFEGAARAENFGTEWVRIYREAANKVKLTSEVKDFGGVKMTYAEVADLLLSMGTEHAYQNFLLKFGINEIQAEAAVTAAIREQPALVNFANAAWEAYGKAADEMNRSFRARTNKLFVKKEPRAFKIGGTEFKGGYVPESKPTQERLPDEQGYASEKMGILSSEKMLEMVADGIVDSIVDNTENKLMLFAKWSFAAEPFNNAVKFMSDNNMRAALGEQVTNYVSDWMRGYNELHPDEAGCIRKLSSATTMAALGWKVALGVIQLSGLLQAGQMVGARSVATAFFKNAKNAWNPNKLRREAISRSNYMATRYTNPVSAMFGKSLTEYRLNKITSVWQKFAMFFITYFDSIVSLSTWDAAYNNAIAKGVEKEQAIMRADSAVRLSQTDGLQISRAKALQAPVMRMLTPFSTYMMGMQSVVRGKLAANKRFDAAAFAFTYIVAATFAESLFKELEDPSGDDDDDKKYLARAMQRWYNEMVRTAGSTIVPFAGIGGSLADMMAAGIEKAATGEKTIFDTYGVSTPALQYVSNLGLAGYHGLAALGGDSEEAIKAMLYTTSLFSTQLKKELKKMVEE